MSNDKVKHQVLVNLLYRQTGIIIMLHSGWIIGMDGPK